jgi:hypothetical protein
MATRVSENLAASDHGSGFDHRAVHVGFVVNKLALGQIYFRVLYFTSDRYHTISTP